MRRRSRIVRPVCGIDNYRRGDAALDLRARLSATTRSCSASRSARDPVVPLVRAADRRHPQARARLLIGDDRDQRQSEAQQRASRAGAPPQHRLDRHRGLQRADAARLHPAADRAWRRDTGLVCAPPIGCRPDGFWAELECAFLNTYQARWQYLADTIGVGFAQGKTMLWRRDGAAARPAASRRWRSSSPRTRPRPRSSTRRACACAWSTRRSGSRSDIAALSRSGAGRCAGRGCAARAFRPATCPSCSPARRCRCSPAALRCLAG